MVEHSISYNLAGKKALIQQREVGTDVPDMMTGLSTSIAQASDVLMIGELRCLEEINLALMASQNFLVLTQLHADTPQAAIERMVKVFPEDSAAVPRRILADKLQAACAQTLVQGADGKGMVAAYGVIIPDDQMRQDIIESRDIMDRQTPLPFHCRTITEDLEQLYQEGIITKETRDQKIAEFK
jgi:twitching motility protein PilT